MEAPEKEQILYNQIHSVINHVLRENTLTYFQVIGALEVVKNDYMENFKYKGIIDEIDGYLNELDEEDGFPEF